MGSESIDIFDETLIQGEVPVLEYGFTGATLLKTAARVVYNYQQRIVRGAQSEAGEIIISPYREPTHSFSQFLDSVQHHITPRQSLFLAYETLRGYIRITHFNAQDNMNISDLRYKLIGLKSSQKLAVISHLVPFVVEATELGWNQQELTDSVGYFRRNILNLSDSEFQSTVNQLQEEAEWSPLRWTAQVLSHLDNLPKLYQVFQEKPVT